MIEHDHEEVFKVETLQQCNKIKILFWIRTIIIFTIFFISFGLVNLSIYSEKKKERIQVSLINNEE